ncbi:thiopurine S-methyltransferase [Acidithiobacillus montserratensis]|uniref:Thiopurine S-methyltransferase n=1 Tax=Acidithiobacillus montserratensis TaxID=2729135 RepID=A0ACD5HKR2_9PROT|nr:thiopurine S-methyltransferase [Acidithiobacillus montserratensis]MBU2747237.1 thiopurine S-methyltransferase [Acidithiobacillus montserratensis]
MANIQSTDWLQRWQHNRIGFHRPDFHEQLLTHWPELAVEPGSRVFVPLCGKSLDMLWLAHQGFKVTGVELSPIAVETFFQEHGLTPRITTHNALQHYQSGEIEIFCGDIFQLRQEDLTGTTAVYDRAALIALPPAQRLAYVRHLHTILPDRPAILLITLDFPPEGRQGPPFPVTETEVRRLYAGTWKVEHIPRIDLHERKHANESEHFEEHVYILRDAR